MSKAMLNLCDVISVILKVDKVNSLNLSLWWDIIPQQKHLALNGISLTVTCSLMPRLFFTAKHSASGGKSTQFVYLSKSINMATYNIIT